MTDRNTDAPMCQLCDPPRKHWKHESHKFANRAPKADEGVTAEKAPKPTRAEIAALVGAALEEYQEKERAKVAARVRRHRAAKKGGTA